MRTRQSEYMHWAKNESGARFNLASSGVGACLLADLPPVALEINGDNSYGYGPLLRAIAEKEGVDPDCVVTTVGTSFANHLAMAALIEPGDEVLIEQPTYELIVSTAEYLGADVKRFRRGEDFTLDAGAVRRALSTKTKLIVLTNLHNPSSVLAPEPVLREIGGFGVPVLVDEVYLDAVFENTPRSSFHLGPQFVTTNSLTKIYGLSGLRCGWILARPELARAMWRLNDLFGATPVYPAELLSVAALQALDSIRARARASVDADRTALNEFLDRETRVQAARTDWGTTVFMKLMEGGTEEYIQRLRDEYETSVVPGRFFEQPDYFRVGMGVNSEMFAEGLRRIGRAL